MRREARVYLKSLQEYSRHIGSFNLTLLSVLVVLFNGISVRGQISRAIREIAPGEIIANQISGGESQNYEINLRSKHHLRAIIAKGDLNIRVTVYEPQGTRFASFVSRKLAPLNISLTAESPGPYRVEVSSLESGAKKGNYELKLEFLRIAAPQDEKYDQANRAFAEAEEMCAAWKKPQFDEAIKKYSESAEIWLSGGFPREAIDAMQSVGDIYYILSEFSSALGSYNRALNISLATGDRLTEMAALNSISYVQIAESHNALSLEYSKRVLDYCASLQPAEQGRQSRRIEAQALNNLGEVHYLTPSIRLAMSYFRRALDLWVAIGDRAGQALAHLNMGYALTDSGDLPEALTRFKQALSIWDEIGDNRGRARANTAIGGIYSFYGEKQAALDSHEQSWQLSHLIGDKQAEAAVLNGVGKAFEDLNEPLRALVSYNQALKIYQEIHNRGFEAITKHYIGRVYRKSGEIQKALDYYNDSLALGREVANLRIQAYSLKDIALINNSRGEPGKALNQYNELLELYEKIDDRRGKAYTLNSIGYIYQAAGDLQKAAHNYKQALGLFRAAKDLAGETNALYNVAYAERKLKNAKEALSLIEAAIKIIEALRTKVISPDLRASYFASVHQYYDLYIDLLMDIQQMLPGKRFDVVAFQASERARARSLLDILNESGIDIREGVDSALLEREQTLQKSVSAKAERQSRLLSGEHKQADAQEVKEELDALTSEYQKVKAEIRVKSSRYAALTQPEPLSLKQIQQDLLPPDALMLEYFLGDERSFLWAVTGSSLVQYQLPGRNEIEKAAGEFYSLLTAHNTSIEGESNQQRQQRLAAAAARYPEAAARLSQMLIGQIAPYSLRKRLIVIPDGILQYLPFAALPVPGSKSRSGKAAVPLVANYEVTSLPSASTLTYIRKDVGRRAPASKLLAIFADPVFESNDSRVKLSPKGTLPESIRQEDASAAPKSSLDKAIADLGQRDGKASLPRLIFTHLEAEAVTKLTGKVAVKKAIGFEANKANVKSADIGAFRIIHFATHGILDNIHPELSGIVLSLVDEQGKPQDGFLRLHEVYNLRLSADLVVLSACQTALGKDVRGEGLIGLVRGFMYAGAPRVMASLWSVRDEATSELMKRFYHGLLKEGKTASAALQAAQASMWRSGDWSAPYYWAGFIIQGELK